MDVLEKEAMYSEIITPKNYNHILSEEHLYIAQADKILANFIEQKAQKSELPLEVVELGCGPARVSPLLASIKNIRLTGIDRDSTFIEYAKEVTKDCGVMLKLGDIAEYKHPLPVDIFCSIGVHHHIAKGKKTNKYLKNVYEQLKRGGYYLISDEFLPAYKTETQRNIRLVIWYFHIIASAMKMGYRYLAEEEAKTFLDDIHMGTDPDAMKTEEQIALVMSRAPEINEAAKNGNHSLAEKLAEDFILKLEQMNTEAISKDHTLALSRRDYKICEQVLREEVEPIGFIVEDVISVGPIDNIGAMSVYMLKKP